MTLKTNVNVSGKMETTFGRIEVSTVSDREVEIVQFERMITIDASEVEDFVALLQKVVNQHDKLLSIANEE